VQGLTDGSGVEMAGVRVGQVTDISQHNNVASVSFEVQADQPLYATTNAAIRYADLLGGRYLALDKGTSAQPLAEGSIIPLARTKPAVDLTSLLNGFRPLFDALQPAQVNQLATSLIEIFDGEAAPLDDVLHQVIALTSTITGNDALIGRVLDNLNSVIGDVLGKKEQFTSLVSALTALSTMATQETGQIEDVLGSATGMAAALNSVLGRSGSALTTDLTQLNQVAGIMSANGNGLVSAFTSVNTAMAKIGDMSMYGSWWNIYVCNASFQVGPATITLPPDEHSEVCR
jgi:phospholipid/cholesterol/gamma-HCH transport system substrate-binding protein